MLEPHHAVAAWVGTAIGSVTVTGSLVAYAKLAEKMDSKALNLPGKNMINMVMLGGNMLCLSALALDPLNMSQGVIALVGTTAISSESRVLAWGNLMSWNHERDSAWLSSLFNHSQWTVRGSHLCLPQSLLNRLCIGLTVSLRRRDGLPHHRVYRWRRHACVHHSAQLVLWLGSVCRRLHA